MTTTPFRKMHGLGNDFVVIDARQNPVPMTGPLARRLADRRLGIGADEIIVISPSSQAVAHMAIWNPDGEEVDACGNASRCVAALLMEEQRTTELKIATNAGVLACHSTKDGQIAVDMGLPRMNWRDIPLSEAQDTLRLKLDLPTQEGATLPTPTAVSMGNPHMIFFVSNLADWDLAKLGPELEHHPLFPERANVTLAQQVAADTFRLKVWERGVGLTLACGTAACATFVAASRHGLAGRKGTMHLPGGALSIEWNEGNGRVTMTGPWAQSFEGTFGAELMQGLDG